MSAFSPPPQIKGSMAPYVASVEIERGEAVSIDPANNGNVIFQDNFTTKLPCIGIAANNAEIGQTVWVQSSSIITVSTANTCIPGHLVGSAATVASDPTMNDLGSPTGSFVSPVAIAGIALAQAGTQLTLLVFPLYFELSSVSGVVTSFNGRTGAVTPAANDYSANQLAGQAQSETPATFSTNSSYTLSHTPNPLASLELFVNGVYLVQGVDYTLGAPANTRITFTSTIVVSTIIAFYEF